MVKNNNIHKLTATAGTWRSECGDPRDLTEPDIQLKIEFNLINCSDCSINVAYGGLLNIHINEASRCRKQTRRTVFFDIYFIYY